MLSHSTVLFFSAITLILSFSSHNCYIFSWLAFAPLLVVTIREKKGKGFLWGFIFGVIFYVGNISWINYTLMFYGGIPAFLSIPLLFLLVSYLSLYYGLFSYFLKKVHRTFPAWGIWSAPFIWVGLEWIRSFFMTGFPWSTLGYSQHTFLPVLQISEYTGVYGVSFLIILSNVMLARWCLPIMKKPLIKESAICFLIVFSAVFWGSYKIKSIQGDMNNSLSVRGAFVQGNIKQSMKWDPEREKEIVKTYEVLTLDVAMKRPQFILWPETAVPFLYQNNPEYKKWLEELSNTVGTPIVTGAMTYNYQSKDEIKYFNSAVLVTPDKNIQKVYDKIHLVPFGEYVPFRKLLFFVDKLVSIVGELTPGTETHTYKISSFSFGTAICFEIIFPDLVRRFADKGVDIVMNLTNDAWYGNTDAPFQHWAMVAFRCVENRIWVVRAANTGISGFINPWGKPVYASKLFSPEAGVFDLSILKNKNKTFYTRFGDIFAKTCFVFSFMLLALVSWKKE